MSTGTSRSRSRSRSRSVEAAPAAPPPPPAGGDEWPGAAWVGEALPDTGCAVLPGAAASAGPARRASLRELLRGKRAALLHFFDSG